MHKWAKRKQCNRQQGEITSPRCIRWSRLFTKWLRMHPGQVRRKLELPPWKPTPQFTWSRWKSCWPTSSKSKICRPKSRRKLSTFLSTFRLRKRWPQSAMLRKKRLLLNCNGSRKLRRMPRLQLGINGAPASTQCCMSCAWGKAHLQIKP